MEIPIAPAQKVLVKFHFTNQKLIPSGLRLVRRWETEIETKHLLEGKKIGLPQAGWEAKRPERVDTGEHRQFQNVNFAPVWEQLKQQYPIVDAHCFLQERSTGMQKPVIVITFAKDQKTIPPKGEVVRTVEETFVRQSRWGIIHHWINPNGVITINCLQRQPVNQP